MCSRFNNKSAFTLAETITVVVILSVLAALAIPNLRFAFERVRTQEQLQLLRLIHAAQLEWRKDSSNDQFAGGFTAEGSDAFKDYVEIPSNTSAAWSDHTLYKGSTDSPAVTATCTGGPENILASVVRQNSDLNYTLFLLEDGRIVCKDGAGLCTDICVKIGFEAW